MARLTKYGLVIDRYEDITEEATAQIQNTFEEEVDLTADSLTGVYAAILALKESELWELLQAVYDSAYLASAEGVVLENLALLVGFVRKPATSSRGIAYITADDGEVVQRLDTITTVTGDEFYLEDTENVTPTACVSTKVKINHLSPSEDYTLEINGNVYVRSGNTRKDILEALQEDLNLEGTVTTTLSYEGEDLDENYYLYAASNTTTEFSLTGSSYFTFFDVTIPVVCTAVNTGAVPANAGTLKTYTAQADKTTVSNVVNLSDFSLGTDLETDVDLRTRLLAAYNQVAGSSVKSLYEGVAGVEGVTSVKVVENDTMSVNSRGMPPKSYQAIVQGGDETLVAEAIWDNKPAGYYCYADPFDSRTEYVEFLDYNEQTQKIRFVRPDTKYVWQRVTYTLYDEETFTDNGEEIIQQVLAEYGSTLGIGEDVIPKRFYSSVYKNLKGVEDLIIEMAITEDLNTPPNYPSDYTEDRLEISDEEVTSFASGRVSFN